MAKKEQVQFKQVIFSKMILYFFFKNFVFTMSQFYFAFFCLGSGQTFIDDWYITCYNLIFTAIPLCVSALTDTDIDLNDNKLSKNLPLLYKESRDNHKIFTFGRFFFILFKGTFCAFIIFMACCIGQILSKKGYFANIWYLSLKSYLCVLPAVSSNLLISTNFIVIYLPISIILTTFIFLFSFLILNHYGILFEFNSKGFIVSSLSSPILYFSVFLILILSIVVDYSFKLFNLFFSSSLSSRIILKNSLKKRGKKRKSFSGFNKISSKSNSNYNNRKSNSNSNKNITIKSKNIDKTNNRQNINNIDTSNNILSLTKNHKNFLNNININNKQNLYQSIFNNDIFSLQYRNINKILKYESQNKSSK